MSQKLLSHNRKQQKMPNNNLYRNIKVIAFDADDTLWHNEINFRNAEREFAQAMLPFCSEERAVAHLMEVEGRNIPLLGYGTKTFIIALVEAAIELCGGKAPNELIIKVMEIGKKTVQPQMKLYEHAEQTLAYFYKTHKLVLATKGDLKDQQYKIERSGLAGYFSHIEIMSEKDVPAYRTLLSKCNVAPEEFIMVGNSFKSDIKPVLEIGASAVYIPSEIIWTHEVVEEFDHPNLVKLDSINQLTELFNYTGI